MASPSPDARPYLVELNHRPNESEESLRAALHVVVETLSSLQEDAYGLQTVLRQLIASLDHQLAGMSGCRQTLLTLLHTPPASGPPMPAFAEKTQLRIYCFSPFEVYHGEEYIPQRRTGKGRAILQYLAARPQQPVPRDVLLEILWPNTEPHIANNRLKVAMHHLRQAFSDPDCDPNCEGCIVFRNGCYLFNPQVAVWTDVEAFESNWQTGVRLERAGQPLEAIRFYSQAAALYRGDFLEEDLFEEWTLVRREELKDTYLAILDKLSRYWLQTGNLDDAIEGWKKILAKDPWREDIYRHLMACFAARGQRGLALRWYELCVQALHDQLNLEPEPETVALYERVRSGESVAEWIAR